MQDIAQYNSANVLFHRKFRWILEADFPSGKTKPAFIRPSARPNLSEEHLNKIKEQSEEPVTSETNGTITTTFIDLINDEIGIFKLLGVVYEVIGKKLPEDPVPDSILGTLNLGLCDGCGALIEEWKFLKAYPTQINFGELDYSSSDSCTVEVTWNYQSMIYKNCCTYSPLPPPMTEMMGIGMGIGCLGNKMGKSNETSTGTESGSLPPQS